MKVVEVIKFIADDGTEFDTREECLNHEAEQSDLMSCVIFKDENGKTIPYDCENAEQTYQDAFYIIFDHRNMDKVRYFFDKVFDSWLGFNPLYDFFRYSDVETYQYGSAEPVVVYFDDGTDEWRLLNEDYRNIKKHLKTCGEYDALVD